MAPLPPNNTGRIFYDYTTGRVQHHFSLRFDSPTTIAALDVTAEAVLNALQLVLPDAWTVLGARIQQPGATISLPFTGSRLIGFTGTGGGMKGAVSEPEEYVWVGRSLTEGRRWEMSLYGILIGIPDDFRYEGPGLPPSFGAVIDTIDSAVATGTTVAIDGGEFVIYPYVNVNYNSYWEQRARRG